jgi:hypothetical protein
VQLRSPLPRYPDGFQFIDFAAWINANTQKTSNIQRKNVQQNVQQFVQRPAELVRIA